MRAIDIVAELHSLSLPAKLLHRALLLEVRVDFEVEEEGHRNVVGHHKVVGHRIEVEAHRIGDLVAPRTAGLVVLVVGTLHLQDPSNQPPVLQVAALGRLPGVLL